MTRFARAKGSKSSNERLPNEATPWYIMKQQLDDSSSMKNNPPEKLKSAKELLKEKDDPFYYDTTGNVNTDWAEFESPKAAKQIAKNQVRSSETSIAKQSKSKLENGHVKNGNDSVQNLKDKSITPKTKSNARTPESSITQIAENSQKEEITCVTTEEPTRRKKKEKIKKNINSSVTPIAESISNVELVNETDLQSTKKKKKKINKTTNSSAAAAVVNTIDVELAHETNAESPKKKRKMDKTIDSSAASDIDNTLNVKSAEETNMESRKKKKKKINKTINSSAAAAVVNTVNVELAHETNAESPKKKRKMDKTIDSSAAPDIDNTMNVKLAEETKMESPKKKKKMDNETKSSAADINTSVKQIESSDTKIENSEKTRSLKVSKRHKRNQKRIEKNAIIAAAAANGDKANGETPASGGFDAAGNDWSSNVNFGKQQKFEKPENTENQNRGVNGNLNDFKRPPFNRNGEANSGPKRKAPKIRDDKEHKRKKPDEGSIKCVINGMDVEIVKFDGFPVKKEDAERLKDLRKQMVMKGIPKSDIDGAMKLERRRAEKSLARVRKQVCFHCRKAGHNLSDCPELGQEECATGICFKCGSTEHTHFECKVTKKEEFRFASCFICREQGHIAKQCPDNPKGLYPQGGACKICGDVTHLRKDCPDLIQEKEESAVTLNTITESTLESLDEDITKKIAIDDSKKAMGKIVKF